MLFRSREERGRERKREEEKGTKKKSVKKKMEKLYRLFPRCFKKYSSKNENILEILEALRETGAPLRTQSCSLPYVCRLSVPQAPTEAVGLGWEES